jgi:hypothetical protein
MGVVGFALLILLGLLGCAHRPEVSQTPRALAEPATGAAAPATTTSLAEPAPAQPPSEPQLVLEQPREPPAPELRALPRELPKVGDTKLPPVCARLSAGPLSEPRRACRTTRLSSLVGALELSDVAARDRALAAFEPCSELPEGWLRAVRAELARECADLLITPALRGLKGPLDADLGEIWLGLALAARWGRSIETPPLYLGVGDDDSVGQFLKKKLRPWKERQLAKLERAVRESALLERDGYGATLAALARARATHELFSIARRARIPAAVASDFHFRSRYYAALDAELEDVRALLEPADTRVSALLLQQGIHRASDADAWYWLQPRDFFNVQLLPPPSVEPSTDLERLVRALPAPYVEALFGHAPIADPRKLRLMIEHGLTPRQRRALWSGQPSPEILEIWAYFEATLALRTRSMSHFDVVVELLRKTQPRSPVAELALATARSMRTGQLQRGAETGQQSGWLFDLTPLKALAELQSAGRARALALNNAAWLSLSANTPSASGTPSSFMGQARALAPDEACLRPIFTIFIAERSGPTCDLPGLP